MQTCRSGRVLSWGIADFGQLGNGTTSYATNPEPVQGLEDVIIADIAAGGWHSLALSSTGGACVEHLINLRGTAAIRIVRSTNAILNAALHVCQ